MQARHLNDPNIEKIDLDKGDKEFRLLIRTIIQNLTVEHVEPEEVVILQGDPIMD